jgi:hypothetical protein
LKVLSWSWETDQFSGRESLAQLLKASERMAKVQVANLFNRPSDMALQKINHLATECYVIKGKGADVVCAFVLDYEQEFVGFEVIAKMKRSQDSNFALNRFVVLVCFSPDWWPVADSAMFHQGVVSKLHWGEE